MYYFEYNSTINCSSALSGMSARSGTFRNVPDMVALSRLSHGSMDVSFMRFMDEWIRPSFLLFSRSCTVYGETLERRDCPCWPGGNPLLSTGHFSVKHFVPFRNNFCRSLRHNLQLGSVYLAMNYFLSCLKPVASLADGSRCEVSG